MTRKPYPVSPLDQAAKEAFHTLDTDTYLRIYGDEYDCNGDPLKPKKPVWWRRVSSYALGWLAILAVGGALIGSCYLLVTYVPACQGSKRVPDETMRQWAMGLGQKGLGCKDVKVYILGRRHHCWAYVAVVGCSKKVTLRCPDRVSPGDTRRCTQFSDVMPGEKLSHTRRSSGSGKYYTEWWELTP